MTDGNHVLYKADFQSYYDKVKSLFQRFSGGFESLLNRCDKLYDLMNQMTPEFDGVSADDRLVFFIQIWFPTHNRLLI